MGQFISKALRSTNELGILHHRTYETKYLGINAIKIQPNGGNLLAAATELGSLLIYDLSAETDLPQQFRILSFEVGGISDLIWVSADVLVVGTTRGSLVVFSLKNVARRLFEVCSMKAHGDGACMVAVQSIAFCPKTNCLVSVGQGVGSVRLWDITSDGMLISRDIPSPVAFYEPRFVGFMDNGSHVLVGFLEHILLQKFSIEPWALVEEHTLGQHQGAVDHRELGNAVILDDCRLLVFNLKDGFDLYDTVKFSSLCSARYEVNFCCSQAISALRDGSYVVASSSKGLNIYRTRDHNICLVATFNLPARGASIQAVHASSNSSNNHDIIATASCVDGKESNLTIWMDHSHRLQVSKAPSLTAEYSTLQTVLLSVLVYVLCQLVTSFLLANTALFSTSPVTPVLDLNSALADPSGAIVDVDPASMEVSFHINPNPGVSTIFNTDPGSLKISEAKLAERTSQGKNLIKPRSTLAFTDEEMVIVTMEIRS